MTVLGGWEVLPPPTYTLGEKGKHEHSTANHQSTAPQPRTQRTRHLQNTLRRRQPLRRVSGNPTLLAYVQTAGLYLPRLHEGIWEWGVEVNEHQLQASIIAEVDLRANLDPRWALIFAVPNGGQRSKATAGKLKAEGVKAGVLDLCLPLPAHNFHGMFMELKVGRNRLTVAQQEWYTRLRERGYYCTVVWDSPGAAIQEFEWYISGAKL